MITINLIKDDPVVRGRRKQQLAQARWIANPANRAQHNRLGQAWHALNKVRSWVGVLRNRYGLTPVRLAALVLQQGGRCAICRDVLRGGRYQHIDHDHNRPGTARGVLCSECNAAIGKLHDDPVIIMRAAEYVRRGGMS